MIPNYPFDPAPFTCMHFWHDKGADLYLDACNGEEYEVEDGKDYDAGGGYYMPMGSIMVKPGCTAYLNKDHHFDGDRLELEGPVAVHNNKWGNEYSGSASGPSSYRCRCIQEPVNCIPEDRYDVI